VVHAPDGEQHGDRDVVGVRTAVAEHEDVIAVVDRLGRRFAEVGQRALESGRAFVDGKERREGRRAERRLRQPVKRGHVIRRQDR
jgi:hypothetical protein